MQRAGSVSRLAIGGRPVKKAMIIMCPTVERAKYEWGKFQRIFEPVIRRIHKNPLMIELHTGEVFYYRGETEGQRAVLGYHADIVSVDEFYLRYVYSTKEPAKERYDENASDT